MHWCLRIVWDCDVRVALLGNKKRKLVTARKWNADEAHQSVRKCMDIPRSCAKELAENGGFTLHKTYFSFSHQKISCHPTIAQQGRAAVLIIWFGWYPPRHSTLKAATFRRRKMPLKRCCGIHGPDFTCTGLRKSCLPQWVSKLTYIKRVLSHKPDLIKVKWTMQYIKYTSVRLFEAWKCWNIAHVTISYQRIQQLLQFTSGVPVGLQRPPYSLASWFAKNHRSLPHYPQQVRGLLRMCILQAFVLNFHKHGNESDVWNFPSWEGPKYNGAVVPLSKPN